MHWWVCILWQKHTFAWSQIVVLEVTVPNVACDLRETVRNFYFMFSLLIAYHECSNFPLVTKWTGIVSATI